MRLILLCSLALVVYSAPLDEYVMGDMIFVGDPNKVARNANMNARKWDKGMQRIISLVIIRILKPINFWIFHINSPFNIRK